MRKRATSPYSRASRVKKARVSRRISRREPHDGRPPGPGGQGAGAAAGAADGPGHQAARFGLARATTTAPRRVPTSMVFAIQMVIWGEQADPEPSAQGPRALELRGRVRGEDVVVGAPIAEDRDEHDEGHRYAGGQGVGEERAAQLRPGLPGEEGQAQGHHERHDEAPGDEARGLDPHEHADGDGEAERGPGRRPSRHWPAPCPPSRASRRSRGRTRGAARRSATRAPPPPAAGLKSAWTIPAAPRRGAAG